MDDKNAIGRPRIDLKDRSDIVIPNKEIFLPGELGATIELTVRDGIFDPNGKITNHMGPMKSRSFVQQFIQLLWLQMACIFENFSMPLRDTSNNLISIGMQAGTFACDALANSVLSGIIVGTGITAPDITDYKIETLIAHGVGAGQLQYGIVTFGAPASDATTAQFTITRNFANGSGGAITVNEIALYVEAPRASTPTLYYFMTIRDVIAGGISVLNGQTLTINYRPQVVI